PARQNHAGGVPANCGSGEQVGIGLGINRATRKRLNGLESHPGNSVSRVFCLLPPPQFGIISRVPDKKGTVSIFDIGGYGFS
ncbi:MAG: hypothetical protein IKO72_13765, partial [Kiritimatiellae bacterium]|nr:hypothetical protein [Kiritimatiellia bacterium]